MSAIYELIEFAQEFDGQLFDFGSLGEKRHIGDEAAAELKQLNEMVEVVSALKKKDVRLEHRTSNRKMYWAYKTQEWEVYSFDRFPTWHYKGNSITDALAALADFTPRPGQME